MSFTFHTWDEASGRSIERTVSKTDLFALMRSKGVAKAEIEFSGGNDEGGPDAYHFTNDAGEAVEVACEGGKQTWNDPFHAALSAPIMAEYGSFAGDFQVTGTLVIEPATDTLRMDKSEQVWQDSESTNW